MDSALPVNDTSSGSPSSHPSQPFDVEDPIVLDHQIEGDQLPFQHPPFEIESTQPVFDHPSLEISAPSTPPTPSQIESTPVTLVESNPDPQSSSPHPPLSNRTVTFVLPSTLASESSPPRLHSPPPYNSIPLVSSLSSSTSSNYASSSSMTASSTSSNISSSSTSSSSLSSSSTSHVEHKLGLIGLTANAFAFIAPGAFLWLTFQVQAANPGAHGSSARDAWPGLLLATLVALLTALPFSELARKYHHAGCGGPYYFADRALGRSAWVRWTRFVKFFVAASLILFYWIYPGVFSAFLALLLLDLLSQALGPSSSAAAIATSFPAALLVVALVAALLTAVVLRGVQESRAIISAICILQTLALLLYTALALLFRWVNPGNFQPSEWLFSSTWDVVAPHAFGDVLSQCAVSILLLVGFESATAMAADAVHASRDIPKAVLLSLLLGAGGFLLEYFATLLALSTRIAATDSDGTQLTGFAALAASTTPIGDLVQQMASEWLGAGAAQWPAALARNIYAVVVAAALGGAVVAVMGTAARLTLAVAQDDELPAAMARTHARYGTPHVATLALGAAALVVGGLSVADVRVLSTLILASNIGVFFLYGATCFVCAVAFLGDEGYSYARHLAIPLVGGCFNLAMFVDMAVGMFVGSQKTAYRVSFLIGGLWFAAYFVYFYVHTRRRRISFLVDRQSYFRPFQLDDRSCYPDLPDVPPDLQLSDQSMEDSSNREIID